MKRRTRQSPNQISIKIKEYGISIHKGKARTPQEFITEVNTITKKLWDMDVKDIIKTTKKIVRRERG